MPAYAEEMAQDLIMFVGTRWCFMIIFFVIHLKFLRLARGKGREEWCVAAGWWVVMWKGEETTIFLALWSMT